MVSKKVAMILVLIVAAMVVTGCPVPPPTPIDTPAMSTNTPGPVVLSTSTDTPSPEPTDTPSPEPTDTPSPEPTDTPSPEPTDTPYPTPTDTPYPTPTPTPPSPESSIVRIQAKWPVGGEEIVLVATGIIYNEEGLVLTVAHGVEGASVIKVEGHGWNRPLSARLKGIDPCQDLAVLEITEEGGPFIPAVFGYDTPITLNMQVRVYGYPDNSKGGDDYTVTGGIVSKVKDQGAVPPILLTYYDLIKTDARISGGNSGGPLVAWEGPDKGKVIGVVQLGEEYGGVGWAVRVDARKKSIEEMAQGSKKNWLGALLIPLGEAFDILVPGIKEILEDVIGEIPGMFVLGVSSGSPADHVGLENGDVIVSMNGSDVNSMDDVCDIIQSDPDGLVDIQVWRVIGDEIVELEGQIDLQNEGRGKPLAPTVVSPTPTPTTTDKHLIAIVQTEALNVREGPGAEYPKVTTVDQGDLLIVLRRTLDCGWLKVLTPQGVVGWVSGRFVELLGDCGDIPIDQASASPVTIITFVNDTFDPLQIALDGPTSYDLRFSAAESQSVEMRRGEYRFTVRGACPPSSWELEGTASIGASSTWRTWCELQKPKMELR